MAGLAANANLLQNFRIRQVAQTKTSWAEADQPQNHRVVQARARVKCKESSVLAFMIIVNSMHLKYIHST